MAFDDIVEKDSLADYMKRIFKKKKEDSVEQKKDVALTAGSVQCVFCDDNFRIMDCIVVGKKQICRPCFFRLMNILRWHWDAKEKDFPEVHCISKGQEGK